MYGMRTAEDLLKELEAMDREVYGRRQDESAEARKKAQAYSTAFWETMHTGMPSAALKEGSDGSGGYLVPDIYEDTLVEALKDKNVLRRLGHTIHTTKDLKLPVNLGGGSAGWVTEGEEVPTSDTNFGQVVIRAHKLATSIVLSDELLEDGGVDLEGYIRQHFAERFGEAEEEAFLTGKSAGRPTGLIHQAPVGAVTERADTITLDDMIDLMYSVKEVYRKNAVWLISDAAYRQLRKLKYHNGKYAWKSSPSDEEPERLFGYPVYTTKWLDDENPAGIPTSIPGSIPALFGDFGYYWIGDRGKRVMKRLAEVLADHGQVKFIASERVDARLVLPEAIKTLQRKS